MTVWMECIFRIGRWRLALAGLISGLSVILLWAAFVPTPRQQQEIKISIDRLLADDEQKAALSFMDGQTLILDWPDKVRKGEQSTITINLLLDEAGQGVETGDISDAAKKGDQPAYDVVAITRLELSGFDAFLGEIREPVRAGQDLSLYWDLHPNQVGLSRGKVWLYLELFSIQARTTDQILVMARPIEIETGTIIGLPLGVARVVGGIGIVTALTIANPVIMKKKRNSKSLTHAGKIGSKSG